MIWSVSGRTDICAFYSDWFINRIKAGFVDVCNPYFPNQVKRVLCTPDQIDAIIFCTKNPIPMLPHLAALQNFQYAFQITITPYGKEMEPGVPDKTMVIAAFQQLSQKLGSNRVVLRYDPIILNQRYTLDYHIRAFERLCMLLKGYTNRCIISFVDLYPNMMSRMVEHHLTPITKDRAVTIARAFVQIARKYQIQLQTCGEPYDFQPLGLVTEGCISQSWIESFTSSTQQYLPQKKRRHCKCVQTVDIGAYSCCPHLCTYCYANRDRDSVMKTYQLHDVNSFQLLGKGVDNR